MATLTPLQQRILNVVRRAGGAGIAGDDLFAIVYDGQLPRYRGGHAGRAGTRARTTLKASVWHLNKLIKARGYRIVGSRCVGRLVSAGAVDMTSRRDAVAAAHAAHRSRAAPAQRQRRRNRLASHSIGGFRRRTAAAGPKRNGRAA